MRGKEPSARTLRRNHAQPRTINHRPSVLASYFEYCIRRDTEDGRGPWKGRINPASDSKYESEKISLRQGDVLVLYTDGAVDAENPAEEQYAAGRLSETVRLHLQQNASELIETIYGSVTQFRETKVLADDLTLVVVKML